MPISFFKTHEVKTSHFTSETFFESSGTTGTINSRHYVKDISIYKESFRRCFSKFYGDPQNWCILGLLPSYLERRHSSLVMMADDLITQSRHEMSGTFLYDHQRLFESLQTLEAQGQQTILLGVSFALLDFATAFSAELKSTVVMETGGMKGRREEWTREQFHAFLCDRLGVKVIHSEYGMTELLSQAYSAGNGIFRCPPWMRVVTRSEDDPLAHLGTGKGLINVIDLANINSCCFISTEDAGTSYADGSFEISGRTDYSDLRGCSLLSA